MVYSALFPCLVSVYLLFSIHSAPLFFLPFSGCMFGCRASLRFAVADVVTYACDLYWLDLEKKQKTDLLSPTSCCSALLFIQFDFLFEWFAWLVVSELMLPVVNSDGSEFGAFLPSDDGKHATLCFLFICKSLSFCVFALFWTSSNPLLCQLLQISSPQSLTASRHCLPVCSGNVVNDVWVASGLPALSARTRSHRGIDDAW